MSRLSIGCVLARTMGQVTRVPDDATNFKSTYSFDHDREGHWLASVFALLD